MKISVQQAIIPSLSILCGMAAIALIPAVHLPRTEADARKENPHVVPAPGLDAFNDLPPSMSAVVAKHLFIPQRKATGQNSFPDLVVKGVFLGMEKSIVFSLKSKPQANLRVWAGRVDSALRPITDPRDPRQPIAEFLREWNVKDIRFSGVTVEHFITGETETYAVNYTPVKKVKDDAERGYGQGIIPQDGGAAPGAVAKSSTVSAPSRQALLPPSGVPPVNMMADRISTMMQRMSPAQKKQFLQQIGKEPSGSNQKTGASGGSSRNSSKGKPARQK